MDYLAHGWSPDEMCRQYPNLSSAEAHAAMAYDCDHRAGIGDEIQEELAQVDRFVADRRATDLNGHWNSCWNTLTLKT